ncbi:uncharacterized protein LOC115750199 [Rhodamnia argentea]|uniref:Uncharacterized protein LOC115750199 n=1 Tax=Rhodamnia argentea TaxID=178133 RepID=A0A8B8Q818_9MYRT|nr:uncharacterized protein LOC115750199 [Rhodamnia argentea]
MEGASMGAFKGLRGYWRRRSYRRLGVGSGIRRCMPVVELGSTRRRRRWSWRIKISPKLACLRSPKKFLIWLRDGYVNMMLRLADSRVGYAYGADVGLSGFGSRPLKEYDQKVIVEVYRALMAAQAKAMTTTRVAPSLFPLATISEIM